MGHKTLTISEEAYEALSSLKKERESFTEAILRLTKNAERGNLLDYIKTLSPDEEFAAILDQVVNERKNISLRARRVGLSDVTRVRLSAYGRSSGQSKI